MYKDHCRVRGACGKTLTPLVMHMDHCCVRGACGKTLVTIVLCMHHCRVRGCCGKTLMPLVTYVMTVVFIWCMTCDFACVCVCVRHFGTEQRDAPRSAQLLIDCLRMVVRPVLYCVLSCPVVVHLFASIATPTCSVHATCL